MCCGRAEDVTAALITEMMGVDAARVVALPLQQPLQANMLGYSRS